MLEFSPVISPVLLSAPVPVNENPRPKKQVPQKNPIADLFDAFNLADSAPKKAEKLERRMSTFLKPSTEGKEEVVAPLQIKVQEAVKGNTSMEILKNFSQA